MPANPAAPASEFIVVFVTVPDEATALSISRNLVGEKLAACVNILSGVRSIYNWEGNLCDENELLCVAKTRRALFSALRECVTALHPYQVPEIIALPLVEGSSPYLAWLHEETEPS